jgi:putative glutamine amidotransferase
MQELGILPVENLELLCVYHENELTSYGASKKYIIDEGITFVKFIKIKETVKLEELFKKNKWSRQFEEIINRGDGIIFTGGMDIPAQIYGEKNSLLTEPTTPYRSYYEISFLFHLIGRDGKGGFTPLLERHRDYPVLAICLGEQSLNVAAGGTLIQDIPSEIYGIKSIEDVVTLDRDKIHSIRYLKLLNPGVKGYFAHFHRIKFKGKSIFDRIGVNTKNNPFVLTSHHQAVKKLGDGLRVIAVSMDGKIIEALEHKKYKNVLGVQFHPEVYKLYKENSFYRRESDGKRVFNPRKYLIENNNSLNFHKKIWKWFAGNL